MFKLPIVNFSLFLARHDLSKVKALSLACSSSIWLRGVLDSNCLRGALSTQAFLYHIFIKFTKFENKVPLHLGEVPETFLLLASVPL